MFSTKARPEIFPLTGIRALAALWVVLFHLSRKIYDAFPQLAWMIHPIIGQGYLGVDLFFILSGFIISYNYGARFADFRIATYWEFLWLRLARLWPVHLAVLGLFGIALLFAKWRGVQLPNPQLYTLPTLWKNVLMIHSWSIPIHESWNVPAWSISCEWLAYLAFPFIIASRLVTASSRIATITAVGALLIMALICQQLNDAGSNSYGVIRISGEFIAGCGLCRLFQEKVGQKWNWSIIIPTAVIGLILLTHFFQQFKLVSYWCVPLLALVVLGLAHDRCAAARLLSTRLFLFGGYISYSLYMVHEICFIALHRFFPRYQANPMSFVSDLLFALAAAAGMYYAVEEPCRKQMRRWFPAPK